jgi:CubicO group peptidase (beta-lactamase class C family)
MRTGTIGFLCLTCALPARAAKTFPGAAWTSASPAAVGLDGAKLDQFAANVGGDGIIVKDGYLVKSWGAVGAQGDWASAAKPVSSTMLFFAIEEGRIAGLDAPLTTFGWPMQGKDTGITFRHVANMTSGYMRPEGPGQAWAYNDYGITLYLKTLYDRVFQKSADEVARAHLAPLSFEDGCLFCSRGGLGLSASPRDFARIGWFWIQRGNWNGTQLLPRRYFDEYRTVQVPASTPRTRCCEGPDYLGVGTLGGGTDQSEWGPGVYGFNWFFNENGSNWPSAPIDTFLAQGHGNEEVMAMIPSLGIVAAARGNWGTWEPPGYNGMNANLKLLVDAVKTTLCDVAVSPPAGTAATRFMLDATSNGTTCTLKIDGVAVPASCINTPRALEGKQLPIGKHHVDFAALGGPSGPVACSAAFDLLAPDAGVDAGGGARAEGGAPDVGPPPVVEAGSASDTPGATAPSDVPSGGRGCSCRATSGGSAGAVLALATLAWRWRKRATARP